MKATQAPSSPPTSSPSSATDNALDTSNLELLVGYHVRRASLATTGLFMECMEPFSLRPVDFSVLNLLQQNADITARQVCRALGVLPPNLVSVITALEKRGAVVRRPHARDKRSEILQLTASGKKLIEKAQQAAFASDMAATERLTARDRTALVRLLKKLYQSEAAVS